MSKRFMLAAAVMMAATSPALFAADAPDTSTWAKFTAFTYKGTMPTAAKAGEYLNPIVAGFHPDPTICRVGDDYYLVNSAFNYFPSLPIFHSKDLVNWTQIGNVLDRPSQFPMRGGAMDRGTYAPTIRFNKGTYYIVNTLVGSALNNFYVTATDPKGPWSEPIKLDPVGGIDPDFFFDDDGKAYVTSCADPTRSLYDGHRAIVMQEMDFDQKKPIGQKTVIIDGGTDISKQPHWCEGPHIYKINGACTAMCAQGGTSTNHSEVVFRADNVRGPYTPWEKNPILSQIGLPADRRDMVTCTGHADMVQTQNGEWWAVFLGCQPYDGKNFNTGRETFLLPVSWTADKWPVILAPNAPVPLTVKKPNLPADKPAAVAQTGKIEWVDNFDSDKLDFRWVQIRAPQEQPWYATSKSAKALFLQPRADALTSRNTPSCLLARQQNNDFSVNVTLTAQPTAAPCVAGLTAFHNETHFYAVNVKMDGGKLTEVSFEKAAAAAGRGGPGGARGARGARGGAASGPASASAPAPAPATAASGSAPVSLPAGTTAIELKIEGAGPVTKFFYKVAGGEFKQIGGDLESSFLSTDSAGGFQGVMLGVFAHN